MELMTQAKRIIAREFSCSERDVSVSAARNARNATQLRVDLTPTSDDSDVLRRMFAAKAHLAGLFATVAADAISTHHAVFTVPSIDRTQVVHSAALSSQLSGIAHRIGLRVDVDTRASALHVEADITCGSDPHTRVNAITRFLGNNCIEFSTRVVKPSHLAPDGKRIIISIPSAFGFVVQKFTH